MDNTFIVSGREKLLEPVIASLLTQHQLLSTFDVRPITTTTRELPPRVKGKLKLTMIFKSKVPDINNKFVYGEVGMRLMKENVTTIGLDRIKYFANRCVSKFNNVAWKRGKYMSTYYQPELGFNLWVAIRSDADGRSFIERVLDIQDAPFDLDIYNFKAPGNPTGRYPDTKQKETIANQQVTLDQQRANIDVFLDFVELKFPKIKQPVIIADAQTGWIIDTMPDFN